MLKVIRKDKECLDATPACGKEQVAAHMVVLAACNPPLWSVLRLYSHHHLRLYLRRGSVTDLLQCLLSFMYQEPWGPGVCGGGVPGRDQNTADTVLPPPGGTGECEVVKVREFNSS